MSKNKKRSSRNKNKIPYLFMEGMKGLRRNKVLSFTSVLVLAACIVVVGLFIMLTNVIENNLSSADELYVVTAYVSADAEEGKILEAKEKISLLDNVKSVTYVSKSDALEQLKGESEGIQSVVDKYEQELSGYIRARFDISFESYESISPLVASVEEIDVVETVNTKLDLYHGISKMKKAVTVASSALIVMLFFVAVFVTLNTVRIGIFYRKDEISLMRYMGATKLFITSPYIVECFFMGLVAVAIALPVSYLLYDGVVCKWLVDYGISGMTSFASLMPQIIPAFLCVGLLSSSVSGIICIKKYLNV